jgi:ribose-phosphate pyrophosphokinase
VEVVHKHGAREIYLSFTHGLLSGPAAERLRTLPVKEIVTTNTVPIPPEKRLPNMTVLSVAPLLTGVIWRVHTAQSVGEMFTQYHTYA